MSMLVQVMVKAQSWLKASFYTIDTQALLLVMYTQNVCTYVIHSNSVYFAITKLVNGFEIWFLEIEVNFSFWFWLL